jgi:xanthine dehydrogenase large subunit
VDACAQLKQRLAPVAARLLECDTAEVRFVGGQVFRETAADLSLPFRQVCEAAYSHRVALFSQGYYRTPEIHFNYETGRGQPFYYFAYGAAVSEVEVDGFTGEYRLLRTDILQDAGDPLSPLVDRG